KKVGRVKREIRPPTMKRDKPHTTALAMKAVIPVATRYGITGIAAPNAKATNELAAAIQGDPSPDGSNPSSSRASVSIAVSGLEMIFLANSSASLMGIPFA